MWLALLAWLTGCAPEPASRSDTAPLRTAADTTRTEGTDTAAELEVRFLDVGQGDATLVRSWQVVGNDRRPGPVALIDAGPVNRIVGQLRGLGIDRLDLLIASHNHLDHIGGMDAILDSIPVRFYLDNGHPATTRIQRRVLERVESRGVTYLEPTRRTLTLGSARLHVVPAPMDVGGDEQNNRSLTLVLEQGNFRALFTGDAEVQLLNALIGAGDISPVDVLKASHHGSRNGVTPAFLSRSSPDVVVISVGVDNSYGHPHPVAMRYYCTGGRQVYRTDRHGEVVVRVAPDGTFAVETERRADDPAGAPLRGACSAHSPAEAPDSARPAAPVPRLPR